MIIKTPGVYIKEQRTLPIAVSGVSTAVPVFIGFTKVHHSSPKRITNMAEFELHFGGGYAPQFDVNSSVNGIDLVADRRFFLYDSIHSYFGNGGGPCYICSAGDYATSIASQTFRDDLENTLVHLSTLDEVTLVFMPDLHAQYANNGAQENILSNAHYSELVNLIFAECANLQDKFAVFDYYNMDTNSTQMRNWVTPQTNQRRYGAVYYPWLISGDNYPVSFDAISGYSNPAAQPIMDLNADLNLFAASFSGTSLEDVKSTYAAARLLYDGSSTATQERTRLKGILTALINLMKSLEDLAGNAAASPALVAELTNVQTNSAFIAEVQKLIRLIGILEDENPMSSTSNTPLSTTYITNMAPGNYPSDDWFNFSGANPTRTKSQLESDTSVMAVSVVGTVTRTDAANALDRGEYFDIHRFFAFIVGVATNISQRKSIQEQQLFQSDATYKEIQSTIQSYMKQMPSQGAVAGIYCRNDRDRGVWKSPANMGVQGIERPMVEVSNNEQDNLNVHTGGKSINVIRTFTGKGPVVWGARTWDGESGEWRYIAVRRFFNFAEESIKKALEHFLFEPNNARTWAKIQGMITAFLVDYWQAGALMGTKPEEAFFVRVDETTTTSAEILQGIINIEVGMAVARPAEFIIIAISHRTNA
jgi:phage tail sheath protein FI